MFTDGRMQSHRYIPQTFWSGDKKVFVKHYVPNRMPDPKGEWSLLINIDGNN